MTELFGLRKNKSEQQHFEEYQKLRAKQNQSLIEQNARTIKVQKNEEPFDDTFIHESRQAFPVMYFPRNNKLRILSNREIVTTMNPKILPQTEIELPSKRHQLIHEKVKNQESDQELLKSTKLEIQRDSIELSNELLRNEEESFSKSMLKELNKVKYKELSELKSTRKKKLDPINTEKNIRHSQLNDVRSQSSLLITQFSTKNTSEMHSLSLFKEENKKTKIENKVKLQKEKPLRQFNWKREMFPLLKVEKSEILNLFRLYSGYNEIEPIESGCYRAYVGTGNNAELIKKILKYRGHWKIVENLKEDPHFIWTQHKCKLITSLFQPHHENIECSPFSKQQMSEAFISTNEKSTSTANFLLLKRNEFIDSCEKIFEPEEFSIFIETLKNKFIKGENVEQFGKLTKIYNQLFLKQKEHLVKKNAYEFRLHNHIEGAEEIGDKKNLLKIMKQLSSDLKQDISTLIPPTFHLENPEQINLIIKSLPEGPWILKPGESTNRGNGITVHINKMSLLSELNRKSNHKHTFIVQRYIEPLLYNGRKFDIRIWVLWSGQRLWWFREGYIRTSSKEFNMKNLSKFVHLTNDAIQCQSEDFGKYEPANKLSFAEFDKYAESQLNFTAFKSETLPKMKEIAIKLFQTVGPIFNHLERSHTFELFGLDYLIDKSMNPWLIECNTNPCLEINCSLLSRLIPNMLENVMFLTVDTLFPWRCEKKSLDWKSNEFRFELLLNFGKAKKYLEIKNEEDEK